MRSRQETGRVERCPICPPRMFRPRCPPTPVRGQALLVDHGLEQLQRELAEQPGQRIRCGCGESAAGESLVVGYVSNEGDR
jgi:hypothetical protein